jgi:hypothetical protein
MNIVRAFLLRHPLLLTDMIRAYHRDATTLVDGIRAQRPAMRRMRLPRYATTAWRQRRLEQLYLGHRDILQFLDSGQYAMENVLQDLADWARPARAEGLQVPPGLAVPPPLPPDQPAADPLVPSPPPTPPPQADDRRGGPPPLPLPMPPSPPPFLRELLDMPLEAPPPPPPVHEAIQVICCVCDFKR